MGLKVLLMDYNFIEKIKGPSTDADINIIFAYLELKIELVNLKLPGLYLKVFSIEKFAKKLISWGKTQTRSITYELEIQSVIWVISRTGFQVDGNWHHFWPRRLSYKAHWDTRLEHGLKILAIQQN